MKKFLSYLLVLLVVVFSSTSCEDELSDELKEYASLVASYEKNDVSEVGVCDGSIVITVKEGESPFTFKLNDLFDTDGEFTDLCADTYRLTIYDDIGDSLVFNDIVIEEPSIDNITVSYDVVNVTTYGGNDGSINITANGGIPPYQYKLNDNGFGDSNSFTNLYAGEYSITVKDSQDSTKIVDILISQPDYVQFSIVSTVINDNGVTVTVNGGVKPYMYGMDGIYQTETNDTVYTYPIDSEPIGKHVIMIKDALDSVITDTFTIDYTEMNMSITKTDIDVYGENTGSITINVTEGYGSYKYKLNDGYFVDDNEFTELVAGDYIVYVKDDIDTISETITITQPDRLEGSVATETGMGEITITGTIGGVKPYLFSINGTEYQSDSVFTGLSVGTYDNITVKDDNGAIFDVNSVTLSELQIGDEYMGGIVFEVSGTYPNQSGRLLYGEDWDGNYNEALSKENSIWKLPSIQDVQDVQLVVHNNPGLTIFNFINIYYLYWTNEIDYDNYYDETDYNVFVSKIKEDTTPYQSTRHINSTSINFMLISEF